MPDFRPHVDQNPFFCYCTRHSSPFRALGGHVMDANQQTEETRSGSVAIPVRQLPDGRITLGDAEPQAEGVERIGTFSMEWSEGGVCPGLGQAHLTIG